MDVLVDGTDNFATRFLINDLAVERGFPWVYGGVIGASGMTLTVVPEEGPCLRCLFPDPPPPGTTPTCETAGVLSTAVAVVASIQANEVLKLIISPEARSRSLFSLDLWDMSFQAITVQRNLFCPCCGRRHFTYLEAEEEFSIATLCGRNGVQISPRGAARLDLATLEARLAPLGSTRRNAFLLEVEVEGVTLTVFPDGRAIVTGVQDPALAQGIYARYIGQ
jgi:adenylyltransferase/sulfurtransferase